MLPAPALSLTLGLCEVVDAASATTGLCHEGGGCDGGGGGGADAEAAAAAKAAKCL